MTKQFLPFGDAVAGARSLGLSSSTAWRAWCNTGARPESLPPPLPKKTCPPTRTSLTSTMGGAGTGTGCGQSQPAPALPSPAAALAPRKRAETGSLRDVGNEDVSDVDVGVVVVDAPSGTVVVASKGKRRRQAGDVPTAKNCPRSRPWPGSLPYAVAATPKRRREGARENPA